MRRLTGLRLKQSFLTLCVALSASACSQGQPDFSGTSTFKLYRESETDIMTMKVPNGYIDGYVMYGPPVPGANEFEGPVRYALYFNADLPGLAPRSLANNWKFQFPAELTENIRFSFGTIYGRQGVEREVAVQKSLFRPMPSTGCFYEPQAARDGLEVLAIDPLKCARQNEWYSERDLLFKRDRDGRYLTVLECLTDAVPASGIVPGGGGRRYNPMCKHDFYDGVLNAHVTLHYPRPLRPDWSLLEQTIKTLLHSFVVTTPKS